MSNPIIGLILLAVGFLMLNVGIFILRILRAHTKAEEFIRENHLTDGIFVKHGMVTDKETGLVRGTISPSYYAIEWFF